MERQPLMVTLRWLTGVLASVLLLFAASTARAETFDLNVDYNELEDGARWFTRDELRRSPEDDSLRLPRKDSIARRLLNEWIEAG